MEWFYAKDGEQVGPVTDEILRGLVDRGVVEAEDLVWQEGMAEWVPSLQVAELQAGVNPLRQLDGSPLPPSAMPPRQNGLALASMILGICSFVTCAGPLTGIPGVICGHMANKEMRASAFQQTGHGMAKVGLILSYIASILGIAIVVVYGVFMMTMVKTVNTYSSGSFKPVTPPSSSTPASPASPAPSSP